MASAFSIARLSLSASRRLPSLYSHCPGPVISPRWLSTSASRWANSKRDQWIRQDEELDEELVDEVPPDLPREEKINAQVRQLMKFGFGAKEARESALSLVDAEEEDRENAGIEDVMSDAEEKDLEEELLAISLGPKPNRQSLWYDEDDPETFTKEHAQFDEDDMTSMAHGKLEEVREMRHYCRLIVWEMPLLSKFRKPFALPKSDEVLRWRYTTYMGESHPAQKKVVVQFAVDDMGLTPVQADKLRKLAGPRYDPAMNMIKMSCESFEFPAQNRRHLSDLIDKLVAEAKDPTDTFEDVPLDLRHKPMPTKPRFPIEWRLTDERRRQLEEQRKATALAEDKRIEEGCLVDGKLALKNFLSRLDAKEELAKKVLEKAGQVDVQFPIPAMGGLGSGGGGSSSTTKSSIDWMREKTRSWSRR
ncbi:hypothetical protein CP533_0476 [Ophiocordyceps camponoti-saundersi (nom. inval.)]|nr:hypothetical protein CP533_0476 [Ophiocordyceps camponoti-saundersi (nom. inval.)]